MYPKALSLVLFFSTSVILFDETGHADDNTLISFQKKTSSSDKDTGKGIMCCSNLDIKCLSVLIRVYFTEFLSLHIFKVFEDLDIAF